MKYFTIKELTRSMAARKNNIDNTPTKEIEENLVELVEGLLDPIREAWSNYCIKNRLGNPALLISSGYRSKQLNEFVNGSSTSAHMLGYAADIIPYNGKFLKFLSFCKEFLQDKPFDQLINEYNQWVHIGYKNEKGLQRKQVFSIQ